MEVFICKDTDGSMSQVVGLPNNSYKSITNTAWVRARLCKLQKSALDPHVIKFVSYLPMVGGSLRVLRLLPPLKLVAMIQLKYLLKVALQCQNSINQSINLYLYLLTNSKYEYHSGCLYKKDELLTLREHPLFFIC